MSTTRLAIVGLLTATEQFYSLAASSPRRLGQPTSNRLLTKMCDKAFPVASSSLPTYHASVTWSQPYAILWRNGSDHARKYFEATALRRESGLRRHVHFPVATGGGDVRLPGVRLDSAG